jgi:hypothetical protein
MDENTDDILKGDERRGIYFNDSKKAALVVEEVINNRTVWAVDIKIPDCIILYLGISCSGCQSVSECYTFFASHFSYLHKFINNIKRKYLVQDSTLLCTKSNSCSWPRVQSNQQRAG